MKIAQKPYNEAERLSALYEYRMLDTLPDEELDNITQIASGICGMPIGLITLLDNDRQWFKSKFGLNVPETSRDYSFCAHSIMTPNEVFVVNDSSLDERFFDNPLVIGSPTVMFYAGVPLMNPEGFPLGALCVIDNKPNKISTEQKETLQALAKQVMLYFEVHKKNTELLKRQTELNALNKELEQFAYVLAHDIKSPCSNVVSLSYMLTERLGKEIDPDITEMLGLLSDTSHQIAGMVDGILEHARSINSHDNKKEKFTFWELVNDIQKLLYKKDKCDIKVMNPDVVFYSSRSIIVRVLLNLCTNAIKYNNKESKEIMLSVINKNSEYVISVADNGAGIDISQFSRIFDLFKTIPMEGKEVQGHGIGLYTVKRLVERMGGTISLTSEVNKGSTFSFTVPK